jgi:hypothetical protein
MPDWLARLRNIVWIAVIAVAMGVVSVATAFAGASLEVTTTLALFSLTLATLAAPR